MYISVENPHIKERHDRHNSNHGAWYDVVYMSIARWIGEDNLVIEQSKALVEKIERLVKKSGDMPHETARYVKKTKTTSILIH